MSLLVIGLYFLGHNVLQITSPGQALFVPPIAMLLAAATAIYSAVAYFFGKDHANTTGLIAYCAIALTIGSLVELTGGTDSPFAALWLLIGVLAGMFGPWMLGVLAGLANAHFLYNVFFADNILGGDQIIAMALIVEAPLLASYIIWHRKPEPAQESQEYTALQQELSKVSNSAEIVVSSIDDGVVAVDQEGRIQLINPAAQTMLGWPKNDTVGLDYHSVLRLVDQTGQPVDETISPVHQVMVSGKSLSNDELALVTRANKQIIVSLVVSPMAHEGQVTGVIAVFRDITQQKKEERQKAEFISTASHEMRTPVAAIEGYLGLALNPATATIDEKARAYLLKAHESTQHLGGLFQDLLTVSKAEDTRLVVHPTTVDVLSFAKEVVVTLTQKAQEKGLDLVFGPSQLDLDGNRNIMPVYYTLVDANHLREILTNLIDNAIKYTKQGKVTVDISGSTENVEVTVTDSGIGIPPEDVSHLFQKFYRVDNTDTREIGGTGLGLYICRRLVEANNGRISVKSTYGKGSSFTVQLPRVSHDQVTDSGPQQA